MFDILLQTTWTRSRYLQNKQLYTKIIFLVSLIALWIFRWLNAVSFFLVFQGFRAHFRFVDPTAMPLCSISLLYCVFPICGITHLLKKVKKGKFALKLGLAGLKWNHHIYDIISFLEIVFHLPDTPSFSFFTVYRTTPFFSISPSSPSPPPPTSYPNISITYPTVTPLPSLWPDTSNSSFLPKYPSHWLLNWIRRALDYFSDTLTSLTVFRSLQQALTFKS